MSLLQRLIAISPRRSAALLAVTALIWAAFCLSLDAAGHAPTVAPVAHWYRLQALLLWPWLWVASRLAGAATRSLAPRVGGASADSTSGLRAAFSLPLLMLFVLPDIGVYLTLGFDALWPAMAVYGAACVLSMWALAAAVIRSHHRLGWGSAVGLAGVGVLIFGAVSGLLIR